jgi:hypothetical protein
MGVEAIAAEGIPDVIHLGRVSRELDRDFSVTVIQLGVHRKIKRRQCFE